MQIVATLCLGAAVLHTFVTAPFHHLAQRFSQRPFLTNIFHLLAEVEVIFGFWAGLFLLFLAFDQGLSDTLSYLQTLHFGEPLFVFVVLIVCSSHPVLSVARRVVGTIAARLPFTPAVSFYLATLTIGPLLGSFITEPAAMTITGLLLLQNFYQNRISERFKYATLGLLFVNISIGGTLTPFAAPPVLMVARKWDWDLTFMLTNFGWKAVLAIFIAAILTAFCFRRELRQLSPPLLNQSSSRTPLAIKPAFLVALFLSGLIILGGPQRWWLEPLLAQLNITSLYVGAIGLTAITDNAALTYLGSQVPNLSATAQYALVAGSVVGGGLTVIANAPNPIGYGMLKSRFGENGINPLFLFLGALPPTLLAMLCFWPWAT